MKDYDFSTRAQEIRLWHRLLNHFHLWGVRGDGARDVDASVTISNKRTGLYITIIEAGVLTKGTCMAYH